MAKHFETALKELRKTLLGMASLVEEAIEHATLALVQGDASRVEKVYPIEKKVNEAHKAVDEFCLKLLALQQPVGADLRLIVAVIKMNADLERMGDQAVNIAHNTERYLKGPSLKPIVDLPVMAEDARFMVREAIESFLKGDLTLAQDVLKRDDRVDAFKNQIFRDVLEHVKSKPELIEQGLSLILIARNLERIGDYATNVAEDVIFAITGEDVRHA